MTGSASARHLDARAVLDYLDGRLDAASRDRVEAHLGEPCPACRETVRALGALVGVLRADRTPEVPAYLHERALSVFAPATAAEREPGLVERIARLLFDSRSASVTAAARRSVGEARRMRWALADGSLELEIESEAAATRTLRGRLVHEDAALCSLDVRAGGESRAVGFGADGSFVLAGVPVAPLEIAVETPDGRWQLPTVEA